MISKLDDSRCDPRHLEQNVNTEQMLVKIYRDALYCTFEMM